MTLLHTSLAAAGLACIAIPIIIHLLMHRRRKPVMWGAMRFLLEAYRRQRRRLMLEKWLLLACRCLVLALLGLAIGRPLLGRLGSERSGRTLFILIDNGLASGLKADADNGQPALTRHKDAAKAAVAALRESRAVGGALGEGDRVGLIALGGPAEGLIVPPSADLAAVAQQIDAIEPTDSRTDLAGGMQLVSDALSRSDQSGSAPAAGLKIDPTRTYIALFSDFREGSIDLAPSAAAGANTPESTIAGVRLPAGVTLLAAEPAAATSAPNTAIVGVEPLRSVVVGDASSGSAEGAADLVRIQLRRSGQDLPAASTTVQTRVVASSTGAAPAPASGAGETGVRTPVRWAAGQESAMIVASIPRARAIGAKEGPGPSGRGPTSGVIVASIDNDPLPADNTWRRPIEFREALRVGVVGPTRFSAAAADKLDPASWARLALSPTGDPAGTGIEVIDIEPASIDAARLAGLDALILPRPDLVQDSSWVRIGLFLSSGGVVVVTPPPITTVHLWTDAMIKGLGLGADWTLPREPKSVEGAHLIAPPPPSAAAGAASGSAAPIDSSTPDLLSLVQGELTELLRPVNIRTVLPLETTGDNGRALLRLENGPVLMWAGRPGAAGTAEKRAEPGLLVYLGVALSLDWSDMPAKPLMVPLMQETIRQGVGQARGSCWSIAGSRPAAPPRTVELREVADTAGRAAPDTPKAARAGTIAIDETGSVAQPLRNAGAFAALDDRGSTRSIIAINPDPRASRILPQTKESVGKLLAGSMAGGADQPGTPDKPGSIVWLPENTSPAVGTAAPAADSVRGTLATLFGSGKRGSPIDFPLLIAALALAVIEIGLARWASHAEVRAAAPGASGIAGSIPLGRAAA